MNCTTTSDNVDMNTLEIKPSDLKRFVDNYQAMHAEWGDEDALTCPICPKDSPKSRATNYYMFDGMQLLKCVTCNWSTRYIPEIVITTMKEMESLETEKKPAVADDDLKSKLSSSLYAYDYVLTVVFPGGVDGYEPIFKTIVEQAERSLNETVVVSMGDKRIPLRFVVTKVDKEEGLLQPQGIPLIAKRESGKEFKERLATPLTVEKPVEPSAKNIIIMPHSGEKIN